MALASRGLAYLTQLCSHTGPLGLCVSELRWKTWAPGELRAYDTAPLAHGQSKAYMRTPDLGL